MSGRLVSVLRTNLAGRWWLWTSLFLVGVVTNFGTAVMRLRTILPSPQPIDFGAYYVGSWAMRLGVSPYYWPPDMLHTVVVGQHVPITPTPPVSPPPWIWLTQGLTVFSFPVAAWIWLAIQVGLVIWCTAQLVRIAGHPGWKATLAACPFTITFGSTFLNLTTGQNGIFLLLAVVLSARHLAGRSGGLFAAAAGWVIAVAAKIYPLLWLAAWAFLRRKAAVVLAVLGFAVFAVIWLLEPAANSEYWFRFLPDNARAYGGEVLVDDQSVVGRVSLLGRTSELGFSGREVETRHSKIWRPPSDLPIGLVNVIAGAALVALAAGVGLVWMRADRACYGEGLFYLVVLYALLPIPHMERYNHVAILPAAAWLWGQGSRYRAFTVVAYCLVGLSRLNHFWAIILDWPLGPLATGTCFYAVLVLGGGIAHRILSGPSRAVAPGVPGISAG